MSFLRILVITIATVLFSYLITPAIAAWNDTNIQSIISDVGEIKDDVIGDDGNVKQVIGEFKKQLSDLKGKGALLTDSVQAFLEWLQSRKEPFEEFAGPLGSNPRCAGTTPCRIFREDLKAFFTNFASLKTKFPVIQQMDFVDGSRAGAIVEKMPPVVLFGIHELFKRFPRWQALPNDLEEIFNEIGDPDSFANPFVLNPTAVAQTNLVSANAILDPTLTQSFCDNNAARLDKEIDPVRFNRILFFVNHLKSSLAAAGSLTSEDLGASIVGEGIKAIPNPVKTPLTLVIFAVDSIWRAIETRRANLDICRTQLREIELQVAQCIQLVEFFRPSTLRLVFRVVRTKIDAAELENPPLDVVKANNFYDTANDKRMGAKYKQAYGDLCQAYAMIGG